MFSFIAEWLNELHDKGCGCGCLTVIAIIYFIVVTFFGW